MSARPVVSDGDHLLERDLLPFELDAELLGERLAEIDVEPGQGRGACGSLNSIGG